ncbi:MAG TPA: NAD(P)/FAD-dependent oxidoreductase [Myxococcales bacterium]|jgi:2-polyprenyl-6-methoxyphenol hydroxylase-like FAD-dependent oxidoreductase
MDEQTRVAIIGGGPVGLFLGLQLRAAGVECLVLERRCDSHAHSRAIGIHPPALELLQGLGVAESLLARGRQVRRGHAFLGSTLAGTLSFERCPPPFRFVLSIPQEVTERVLEERLRVLGPDALHRGWEVLAVENGAPGGVELLVERVGGERGRVRADLAVGCDGRDSLVRRGAGIPFAGDSYDDPFVMGDFEDTTAFGDDAALFLHPDGVLESFPLPGGRRRWVARVTRLVDGDLRTQLASLVAERAEHPALLDAACFMTSHFRAQRFLAKTLVHGRLALAGDAAHVVSPIGGQGMNLGWLNAALLGRTLISLLKAPGGIDLRALSAAYSAPARRRARRVARRAAFNTLMASRWRHPTPRDALVRLLLRTPLRELAARVFTMRGLGA